MVSIVVPVYNAGKYIEKTIESVRTQTYEDWELILVDDRSSDDSVEKIKALQKKTNDKRIILICKERNEGAAKARNTGVEASKGRYVAFLDADDLWYPDKLLKELQYMDKTGAGFVFTSYHYGDEEGNPLGKVVHVPKSLAYRKALSRTVIFTSTVLIDTQIVDKSLLEMPDVGSEDSATWWKILKSGINAYGLDEALAIYRRPGESLSSNKGTAVKRIWNLYRNVEHLSLPTAVFCLCMWAFRATVRRVLSDVIWRYLEALKRFTAVQLSIVGIVGQTGLYAYAWFKELYPYLAKVRVSQEGYLFGGGLKLYFRGHLLILAIYFMILLFISKTGDGMKTGYQRPGSIIAAQLSAILITDVITYFQLSLIRNWLIPVIPMLKLLGMQLVLTIIWTIISDWIYSRVFPPKEILVVQSNKNLTSTIDAFNMRQDRYRIVKVIDTDMKLDEIKHECLYWYGAVILGEMDTELRNDILEFCYSHFVRVYMVPQLSDLLINCAGIMELIEAPIIELKEYGITWENRMVKRALDQCFSTLALIILIPSIIIKSIKAKIICGQVWKSDTYTGRYGKEFRMRRFAYKEEAGTTEKLMAVFRGRMSIVGPMAYTKEKTDRLLAEDSNYKYRLRTKPGITGYAQAYGGKYTNNEDMLKYDMIYVQRYSLARDMRILVKAIKKG
ncbi:MAG: glycosyltransferase [Lachnospiraceae bacterium]|nr:glycosyltransferase [Lachnospiraceae bacterium]